MNVVMIGADYVGLVSGTCFAEFGANVICLDKDETKIDDMRESPSLAILPALADKGAIIKAHDPEGMEEAKTLLPVTIQYMESIEQAITGADAIVLMTEWNQYHGLDLAKAKLLMKGSVFVDLRNVYEPELMARYGFEYSCVGR